MRTRFVLVPCAIVLMLSRAAIAAEDAIEQTGVTPGVEPQLILLHQPPRRVVETSPGKRWRTFSRYR